MTENQWLTNDDPAVMCAFIKDRITERQSQYLNSAYSLLPIIADSNKPMRAAIIREIVGNPFRMYEWHDESWGHSPKDWDVAYPSVIHLSKEWLTWNNHAIPNMVAEILTERLKVGCPECSGEGHFCERGIPVCLTCKGTGLIESNSSSCRPRTEPQWSLMPVLADALDEAGCTELAIIDHLRGEENCLLCPTESNYPLNHSMDCSCGHIDCPAVYLASVCQRCNGTGKRPITHVAGCWVLELLGSIDIPKQVS